MKNEILSLLKESGDKFLSGQEISEKIGVSRTAIWKWMKQLKEDGYEIESISRKGYRLKSSPDRLSNTELSPLLNTECIGKELIYLETVDSTNEEIKRMQESYREGLVIISEEQSKGKGRLGREWKSQKGKGIYMSILLKPEIDPQEASKITQIAAAATAKSLLGQGIDAKIKWPNDIIVNHKKVAGILTEMSGELMKIEYISVGIGININNDSEDFPEDINSKASSLKLESKREFSRKVIAASILNMFELLYRDFLQSGNIKKSLEICKDRSIMLGKEVRIISKNQEKIRKAIDINESGELVVEDSYGNREEIFSGEVSVRGLKGYI